MSVRLSAFFFLFSDAKFKPAAKHALTQPRASAEGARSVLPMRWGRDQDGLITVRLMPFLPDDAPSPSQAN
jgi:hypothetical protein